MPAKVYIKYVCDYGEAKGGERKVSRRGLRGRCYGLLEPLFGIRMALLWKRPLLFFGRCRAEDALSVVFPPISISTFILNFPLPRHVAPSVS